MDNLEKQINEKGCNCKHSKCMKHYCECFSARIPCGKNCKCYDCHNSLSRDIFREGNANDRRHAKDLIRGNRGCACKRSNCTKKYCECYQSGIMCNQLCKCIDCNNNESITNRRVINQLRKNNSDISNAENSSLYPLYLSQNSDHLKSIIKDNNPFNLQEEWLDNAAKILYLSSLDGSITNVLKSLIQILSILQQNINENKMQQSQVMCQSPIQIPFQHLLPQQQLRNDQEQLEKLKSQKQILENVGKMKDCMKMQQSLQQNERMKDEEQKSRELGAKQPEKEPNDNQN